jgi:hypothetical protein
METNVSMKPPSSRKKPTSVGVNEVRDPPRAVLLQHQKQVMTEPGFNKDTLRPFGSLGTKKARKKIADEEDDPMDEEEDPESMAKFVEEGAESEDDEDYAEREREIARQIGESAAVKHLGLTVNRTTVIQCLALIRQWIANTPHGAIPIYGRVHTISNEDARGDTRNHPGLQRMRLRMDQVHAHLACEILHPKGSALQRPLWAAAARPPHRIEVDVKHRTPLTLLAYEELLMEHLAVKMMGTVTLKDLPGFVLLVGQWYFEGFMFSMALLLEPATTTTTTTITTTIAPKKKGVKSRKKNEAELEEEEEEESSPVLYEEPFTFRAIRDFRSTSDEAVDDKPAAGKGNDAPTFWYISYTFVDTALAEAAGEVLLVDHEL